MCKTCGLKVLDIFHTKRVLYVRQKHERKKHKTRQNHVFSSAVKNIINNRPNNVKTQHCAKVCA